MTELDLTAGIEAAAREARAVAKATAYRADFPSRDAALEHFRADWPEVELFLQFEWREYVAPLVIAASPSLASQGWNACLDDIKERPGVSEWSVELTREANPYGTGITA